MPTALIIGASRGIGLGLAAELARRGWDVIATVRRAADEAAVRAAGATPALADITDTASLAALRAGLPASLDLLNLNAGISGPRAMPLAAKQDAAALGHLFLTNAVAPVAAAELLADLVPDGGVIAFTSSQLGSVTNARGNLPLYSRQQGGAELPGPGVPRATGPPGCGADSAPRLGANRHGGRRRGPGRAHQRTWHGGCYRGPPGPARLGLPGLQGRHAALVKPHPELLRGTLIGCGGSAASGQARGAARALQRARIRNKPGLNEQLTSDRRNHAQFRQKRFRH